MYAFDPAIAANQDKVVWIPRGTYNIATSSSTTSRLIGEGMRSVSQIRW